VVPCNQDVATVDILERAARVDAAGVRTIGVLTKPDLISPGGEDEVVQVLLNIRKPLKLGYIMVKNFSQKQMNDGVPASLSRKDENEYFAQHPVFSSYLNKVGVDNLIFSLTKLLVSHIKRTIPIMVSDVKRLLTIAKEELVQLGNEMPRDAREQQSYVVKKITQFCQVLRHSARGEYRDAGGVLAAHENMRLHFLMQNSYKDLQDRIFALRPVASLNSAMFNRLKEEMTTQRGRELPGFINTQVIMR
jgi:interferon-induced GTP-binding protein Mx1